MEEITVENNLDKECNALGGLFQHIVDETKVGQFLYITKVDSYLKGEKIQTETSYLICCNDKRDQNNQSDGLEMG